MINKTKCLFYDVFGRFDPALNFKGKDSILSGPAGGVVGSVETIKSLGINK